MPPHISFDGEEQFTSPLQTQPPKIVQRVIQYSGGIIKNEEQANYVLLGFVVVAIVVSLFLFSGGEPVGNPGDIKILPAVF